MLARTKAAVIAGIPDVSVYDVYAATYRLPPMRHSVRLSRAPFSQISLIRVRLSVSWTVQPCYHVVGNCAKSSMISHFHLFSTDSCIPDMIPALWVKGALARLTALHKLRPLYSSVDIDSTFNKQELPR